MEHNHNQKYTCPMHPEVVKDEPGECPKCGMNLVPLKSERVDEEVHTHKHDMTTSSENINEGNLYYCPMLCEGDKRYSEPGRCPICGMHLVKVPAGGIVEQTETQGQVLAPLPLIKKAKSKQGAASMAQGNSGEYFLSPSHSIGQ